MALAASAWQAVGMNERPDRPTAPPHTDPNVWSELSGFYEARFVPFSSAVAEAGLERLELRPGERLLDVAAGTGALAIPAAVRGARVTAVDFAPEMLRRLRAKLPGGVEVETREMDGTALQFADASFERVGSNLGVVLFADPPKGLAEMRRVLRPGGRALVTCLARPSESELMRLVVRALASVGAAPPSPQELPFAALATEEGLHRALADAGFEDVTVVTTTLHWDIGDPALFWDEWGSIAPPTAPLLAGLSREAVAAAGREFVRLVESARGAAAVFETDAVLGLGAL